MRILSGLGIKALVWLQFQGWATAVSAAVLTTEHAQLPFQVEDLHVPDHDHFTQRSAWDLKQKPSVNDTSNLIFDSVNSLLQHWPNTRYRNGHTLVVGAIPPGTLLYHGTYIHQVPKTPEWVAMDPEHSFYFCIPTESDQGCWELNLITTRALKVLYFDGSSAAKMADGAMDSQDLIAWGKVVPERVFDEKERIVDLCAWGEKYGIDGYVRMEMDFEVMLCDFSKGVKTVSFLNLASDRKGPPRPDPKGSFSPESSLDLAPRKHLGIFDYRVIEGGSWHNRFPGDTRIQLDYTRLISFYDTASFPSLQSHRFAHERFFHRLDKISSDDSITLHQQLDENLGNQTASSTTTGIDWRSLFHVISNRYAERLEMLQYTLNSTSSGGSSQDVIERTYRFVRSLLATYIIHNVAPPESASPSTTSTSDRAWAQPVFKSCVAPYSYLDVFDMDGSPTRFTRSEKLLASSATTVVKEICRVLVNIWAEGVELDLSYKEMPMDVKAVDDINTDEIASRWSASVSQLIEWLDWSYWVRCRPACNYEETCYLPTWPYFGMPGRRRPAPDAVRESDDEEPAWVRPQPKCIPRVEPFGI